MPVRLYIDPQFTFRSILAYVFNLISENKRIDFEFVPAQEQADLKVIPGNGSDFIISRSFYSGIAEKKFSSENYFTDKCMIRDIEGREDLLGTIFYCVNSLQEYNQESDDELGRFQYNKSYQHRFGNIDQNYVQQLINKVCENPKLKAAIKPGMRKSKIFLTHDIDSIHGAWKEDGFYALKKMKPAGLFSLMLNEALGKPDWLNMDKIMKIEGDHGFTSTFYWLLYKDKSNSDYDFNNSRVQRIVDEIDRSSWENGLHKSLRDISFKEELLKLKVNTAGNRYHYLNFKVPEGYGKIEEAGLKLDTSLGFTEQWGFRNSYGLPLMPYNLKADRVFDFIEVPMQVMDRTFFSRRIPVSEVKKILLDWFDKNRHDCVFSLNFHNNFFSDLKYGGYVGLYKSILAYFRDTGFEPVTQTELVNGFYKPEKFK